MNEEAKKLGQQRRAAIIDLLLKGAENEDIANELGIAKRTVKAYLNKLFVEYGISRTTRIKRVVLAVKIYREQCKASGDTRKPDTDIRGDSLREWVSQNRERELSRNASLPKKVHPRSVGKQSKKLPEYGTSGC